LAVNDGLDLNLADGLGDDALGKFTENRQLLLNDLNGLILADDSLGVDFSDLVTEPTEVIRTVEAIEVAKLAKAAIVVERDRGGTRRIALGGHWRSHGGRGKGNDGRNGHDGLGEHFD